MITIERDFTDNGSRYPFDFQECSNTNGFAQIDTNNDAWYFGMWANPETYKFVTYAEGDITRKTADTAKEFVKLITDAKAFYESVEYGFRIDPLSKKTADAFKKLGLGNLLH